MGTRSLQLAMRRRFYPSVDSLAPLNVIGTEIASLGVKAVVLADTSGSEAPAQVAYLSPASGYVSIYRKSIESGGKAHSIITGGRSADLESFHPFESRMDASRPGLLLFTARYGDRDALIVWDLKRKKMRGRYQFSELVSLLSPHWMPDGRSIVLSGLSERGVSDLYRVRLPGGELEPLTADRYQDLDPSPSADGRRLVFASDRTADGRSGAANLFLLDLGSGGWTNRLAGPRTAASTSPPTGMACSTSSPSTPRAPDAARPPPGPAPSTPCRCPTAGSSWAASTT